MVDLDPRSLTWTALLGRWMDYARAVLAIPSDAAGDRWRESTPAVISLQAVTFALSELAELPVNERAFARDKAAVLIDEGATALHGAWDEALPDSLHDVIDDAWTALSRARFAGATELVWPGDDDRAFTVMPAFDAPDAVGTLAVMQPGTLVRPGEPVAWWADRPAPAIELPDGVAVAADEPRQVYRQFDDTGRILRDVLAPITDDPAEGLPLLVPLCEEGRAIGAFTLEARAWEAKQRGGVGETGWTVVEA